MKACLLSALLLLNLSCAWASQSISPEESEAMINRGDIPALCHALIPSIRTPAEWRTEVERVRSRYEDWESSNAHGTFNQFLNDQLVIYGLSAASGKIDKIQKGVVWLAFYHEFNQQPPPFVSKFTRQHRDSLVRLFNPFSWEKAAQYIATKSWKMDLPGGTETASR